ncbi:MAG: preprotein translocase subunit YajC [Clostridiales Family XIII bacterium]|jgi:preprotein translocase subunit YajC|nr:preprotein translocase subunit YajC [Clostridiales Family XIII bacterium]
MFKGTKRIAAVTALMAVFAALALSGCVPTASTGGDGTSSSGGLMAFLPLIVIIAVFYFILIRPQNKKNKQVAEMRNSLKRGDYVTTIGGLKGRVVRVRDDLITIEVGSDKTKLDIMRWGISKIESAAPEKKKAAPVREEEPEEEQPKRKPRKLAAAPKKEPEEEEIEDLEPEEILDGEAELEEEEDI